MLLPTDVQFFYFFMAICSGIIIGVLFDIYRVIRGFNCPQKFLTAVSDILFWIFAAAVVFVFMLYTNRGDFRAYTLIGIAIGLFIYIKFVSHIFVHALKFILYYTLKTLRIIFAIILLPIKLLIYGIRWIIMNFRSRNLKKVEKK